MPTMTQTNQHLTAYSLKLSTEDRRAIKLDAATRYINLYEWFDEAVKWAAHNKADIRPLASTRSGSYSSYYLSKATEYLTELEEFWGCSTSRALYTAVIGYMNRSAATPILTATA